MRPVGDCLYSLAERFIDIPTEPPCCSIRLTLNAYGEVLTLRHLENLSMLILKKLRQAEFDNDRITYALIKKFLKKAVRHSRLT